MIIYSAVYLPIINGFKQKVSGLFLTGEITCLVEALFYNLA